MILREGGAYGRRVTHKRDLPTAVKYFSRALCLRCPECGERPMFTKWYRVRSLREWFSPLDGCPRCGYAYEREPGYFLMAIWAINYGFSSLLGLVLYGVLETFFVLPIWTLLAMVLGPVLCFSVIFARHSKAFFLAGDLFFDPHEKEGGDNGGNKPPSPPPAGGGAPASRPVEPCAPVGAPR